MRIRAGPPVRIFINYRREDTSGYAGWLYEALSRRYGGRNVFMDVDTIMPGEDFHEVLGTSVAACDVLVAVIGRDWLTVTGDDSRRRIDDPDDWVRIEIESALSQNLKVIPALVEGARPLSADELPEPLRPLAGRQAIELANARWRYDVGRLIGAIEQARGKRRRPGRWSPPRRMALGGVGAAIAAAAAVVALFLLSGGPGALGSPGDIVFTRNDGVYRMKPDGTQVHRLYESGSLVSDPSWSPDAKRITFAMNRDVWVLRAGHGPKDLTNDDALNESSPAWSPDGTRIAFAFSVRGSTKLGTGGIGIVSANAGDLTILLEDTNFDAAPSWSPDGTQIAFSTARGHVGLERDIYTLRIRDRSLFGLVFTKPEVNEAVWRDHPSWSPDGKLVAFDTNSGYTKSCSFSCAIETVTVDLPTARFFTVTAPPASAPFGQGYVRPTWIDKSTLLVSYDNRLWKVSASGGTPEALGSERNVLSPSVATRKAR